MSDVLRRALPALLMNQIKVQQRRFDVGVDFEQRRLGGELISRGNGVVARTGDIARSVPVKLIMAELEKTDIRSGALGRIEIGFILATAFMKVKSRPKASDASLISSTGVPTGMSCRDSSTTSAGFLSGGVSE